MEKNTASVAPQKILVARVVVGNLERTFSAFFLEDLEILIDKATDELTTFIYPDYLPDEDFAEQYGDYMDRLLSDTYGEDFPSLRTERLSILVTTTTVDL